MTPRPDVLVLGAGVVGVSAAHFLAARGRTVAVLDRAGVGSGCSYGNAGLVVPSHSVPLAAPGVIAKGMKWMFSADSPFYIKFRFSPALFSWLLKFRAACREDVMRRAIPVLRELHRASVALFDEMAGGTGGVACAYARRGLLLVYRTDEGFEDGRREARLLGEHGLASEELDASAARARVPRLREGIRGAIHFPDDAHLDPARFVCGLAERDRARGVRFLTQTEVTGFEVAGRRVRAVRTPKGTLSADQFVLATGSWSPGLAKELGLRVPIQPAKGYSITMDAPGWSDEVPLILMESKVGVTPMGPRLRLAGTLELAGLDFSINERRVEAIRRGAREYLDGLDGLPELEVWRGLRPCTPDGLPLLGRPGRYENLVLATGHAMIGLSLGPITGKLVAEILSGERPSIDLTLLRPDRF
jgi:D-amino-acid dehydrogenase